MKTKIARLAIVTACLLPTGAHANAIVPGCDVHTNQGAVCAVRGYIGLRQDPIYALGPADQRVRCYWAPAIPHHFPRVGRRWSCHAETAGRFVVYLRDVTNRPEIWQILDLTIVH